MTENKIGNVVDIIQSAGGQLVGRTRLQKIVCLLELAGIDCGFQFEYHHYGPFSEKLSDAVVAAIVSNEIKEEKKYASWGGEYSVYRVNSSTSSSFVDDDRTRLIEKAASANSIVLELAATAAYLAKEGTSDPWEETEQRKYDKAQNGRLDKAKLLYRELRTIAPTLPDIKG